MKILWLTMGDMNTEPVISSLDSIDEWDNEIEIFKFNDYCDKEFNTYLIEEADLQKPDVVLYTGPAEGPHLPKVETFKEISSKRPLIHILYDGACPNWHPVLKKFRDEKCFTMQVNVDGNPNWPCGENDLTLTVPIDPMFYPSPPRAMEEKDILVGFAGSHASPERHEIVAELEYKGIIKINPRNESRGSYQQYADFMSRCKIVPNMSRTGSGKSHHVKARVKEAGLAGCCLLEEEGSPTKDYFKAGEDFLEYRSTGELIDQISMLLSNPLACMGYARNLHKKVTETYSPLNFWSAVFKKVGLLG